MFHKLRWRGKKYATQKEKLHTYSELDYCSSISVKCLSQICPKKVENFIRARRDKCGTYKHLLHISCLELFFFFWSSHPPPESYRQGRSTNNVYTPVQELIRLDHWSALKMTYSLLSFESVMEIEFRLTEVFGSDSSTVVSHPNVNQVQLC